MHIKKMAFAWNLSGTHTGSRNTELLLDSLQTTSSVVCSERNFDDHSCAGFNARQDSHLSFVRQVSGSTIYYLPVNELLRVRALPLIDLVAIDIRWGKGPFVANSSSSRV